MAFVVTSGQVQAIQQNPTFYNLGPVSPTLPLSAQFSLTYEAIWRSQPAVRTVVGFLARNIAQLGLAVYERTSDTDRQRLNDHPLAQLLAQPFPGTPWTRYRLVSSLVHDLCLFDAAYWLKVRSADGRPAVLPLPFRMVQPIGDNWFIPEQYRVSGTSGHQDIPADRLVAFWGYNPQDPRRGVSPIETLRQVLAEEYSAATYREQMWRNGTRTAGYIQRPKDAPRWSVPARDRFQRDWQAQYSGDGPETGGTPILEDGMTFSPAGVTPKDAQYVESRRLTREEVATAYHVPPVLVGLLGEGATFSNVQELHKMLYQDTLPPWLEWITQDIEAQLLPDLDPAGAAGRQVYVEFALEGKLRGSFEEQAGALMSATGGPWMTRAEARARMNLPEIPGADELIVPMNVTEGGLAAPNDTAPPEDPTGAAAGRALRKVRGKTAFDKPPAGPITDVMVAYFARQGRVVLSRAGGKAKDGTVALGDVWDAARWDAELAADLAGPMLTTSTAAARAQLAALGLDPDAYDPDRTVDWLAAHASGVASGINATTAAHLVAALRKDDPADAVRQLFDGYATGRAEQIGITETTHLSGFGADQAAEQTGGDWTKTWLAGRNARPSHSALHGQTVPRDALFANGARWPGDSQLPGDERAGCNCDIAFDEG